MIHTFQFAFAPDFRYEIPRGSMKERVRLEETPDLLLGLTSEQESAVTTTEGPVLIVAGPGSGKTRVLTTRIAYLIQERGIAPWNILALTFTNKAAREMRERVELLVGDRASWITMGTFHSFAARTLRVHGSEIGIDPRFVIYDDGDQMGVVKQAMQQLDINVKQFAPRAVLSGISGAKSRDISPSAYAQTVETYWEEIVARVYPVYQDTLQRRKALDFDDLLFAALRLMRESTHARDKLRDRHKYVLVDEYQDTNHVQYLMVNALSQEHRNICVVGDPDQSIYGWRAADIRNILTFKDDYPEATEIHLEENYRSTPEILMAADSVIRSNTQRIDRTLRTSRTAGEKLILRECSDESIEAQFVVQEINRLQREHGFTGNDFAVLYRTNAQSRPIEEAFIRGGMPYQLIGGTRFYERREIKDVVALLRLVSNPDDSAAFQRVIGAFPVGQGIGAKSLSGLEEWSARHGVGLSGALEKLDQPDGPQIAGRGRSLLQEVHRILFDIRLTAEHSALTELFDHAMRESGYLSLFETGDPEMIDRWDNVLQLRSTLEQYENLPHDEALQTFLEEVALVSDADTLEDDEEKVTLITLHAVKGLEFPVVFITGVEEGLIPHQRSIIDNPESLEEERRLFYVGITRAEQRLYLTHTFRRTRFGTSDMAIPSSFLLSIPDSVIGDLPTRRPSRRTTLSSRHGAAGDVAVLSAEPEFQRLQQGNRVFHNRFGDGIVEQVIDKGDDQEVTVIFKRHGQKRLMASLANLTVD
jgi:DNA helicase II / ATP-dependent DNA helicase PcrA